jgi:uncharacterized membrane protein
MRVAAQDDHPFQSSGSTVERLRRLVERYERGELSDEDFKQLKQVVLHRGSAASGSEPGTFELLLASYSDPPRLRVAIAALRKNRQAGIIDGVLVAREPAGKTHVRAISELSRRVSIGQTSIAAAVCGLLFPGGALVASSGDAALAASCDAFASRGTRSPEMLAFGTGLAPGSSAIAVIVWSSSADAVASSVHGFDAFTRLVLNASVSSSILACLVENDELRGPSPIR